MARIGVQAASGTFFGGGGKSGQFWVRGWASFQGQQGGWAGDSFQPIRRSSLRTGRLGDPEPPRDFAMRVSLALELLDGSSSGSRQARPSFGIAPGLSQRGQPAILVTPLIPTHRPGRPTEGLGHLVLIGPALLD